MTSIPGLLAQKPTAATLMADVASGDIEIRQRAVEQAPLVGTPIIVPLGRVMAGTDPAAAKAALEALRRVAHHAARPKANAERRTATRELLKLTAATFPRAVRVEAIYLLGCIGGSEAVPALAGLMKETDVATEARMALQRIPTASARRALSAAGR